MSETIRKVLGILDRREKHWIIWLFLAVLLMAVIETAGVASILPFMAVLGSPKIVETNKVLRYTYDFIGFNNIREYLFFLGTVIFIFLVLSNIFKALTTYYMLRYENHLYYTLSRRLLAKYLVQPYLFFLNKNTADLGSNVLAEVRNVIVGLISPGLQVIASLFVSLFLVVLLMVVDPLLGVMVALVLGGSYSLVFYLIRDKLDQIGKGQLEANRLKFKAAGEALSGIKDIKILGKESFFLDEFSSNADRHAKYNASAGVISKLPRFALETVAFGGILLIVLTKLGGDQEFGHIVPILALYSFSGYRLLPALQQVFAGITTVKFNVPALNALSNDLRDYAKEDVLGKIGRYDTFEKLPFTKAIEICSLSFSYPGREKNILRNVNTIIEKNSMVGFVGSTGSGKTTIIDILIGLLDPNEGGLAVDGTVINRNNVSRWQRNIGYVPQMIFLSDDTVTRNIAFGVPREKIDMNAVMRAAQMANIDKFIENELPEMYDTFIGEKGVRLSGGQRQRIGIARALYHDPDVLIFDEATSALDGETEAHIVESINSLACKKTIIMIAHRISTLRNCDNIYILDNGSISGQGNYDEINCYAKNKLEAAKAAV